VVALSIEKVHLLLPNQSCVLYPQISTGCVGSIARFDFVIDFL
jgi:hypothetical protein